MLTPLFCALLWAGQTFFKLAAKAGFIDGSMSWVASKLYSRFWNDEQWETPSVCPPAWTPSLAHSFDPSLKPIHQHMRQLLDMQPPLPSLRCQWHRMHAVKDLENRTSPLCRLHQCPVAQKHHIPSKLKLAVKLNVRVHDISEWINSGRFSRIAGLVQYPNEAIMEVHSENCCRDCFIVHECFFDCFWDDELSIGTCLFIVI